MRVFILLTSLLFVGCNSDQSMLKLQPEMGNTYWQKASTITLLKQNIQGQTIDIQTEYITDIRLIPQVVNEDEIIMSAQFRDLRFNVESPFGKIGFNSKRPDTTDFAAIIFSRLNQTPFSVHFSPSGTVQAISGMDDVMNNAYAAVNMSAQQQAEVKRMLDDVYGPRAIKSHLEMSAAILPNKRVAVGDSWTVRAPFHANVKGLAEHTYTLKERRKESVSIQGKSIVKPDPDFKGLNQYNINGTIESYFNVDPTTGWVRSGVVEVSFEGSIITQNPEGGNIEIPMSLNGKTEIRAGE
jgi:hypothetical protein